MKGRCIIVIYTDADACPVKEEIDNMAKRYNLTSFLVSTTAHASHRNYHSTVVTLDADPESVDLYIVNQMGTNDIVITQDNGLAAVVLQKGGQVLTPRGKVYRKEDIQLLLLGRFAGIEIKRRKMKPKQTPPFKRQDRKNFEEALEKVITAEENGGVDKGDR